MAGKRSGKTVVVKIGSSTLTNKRGTFRLSPVAGLVAEICELHSSGHRVIVVSSGAVSSGMGVLRFKSRPTEVVDLQAAAAVGQGRLFHIYTELFAHENVVTAQVLLTAFDVAARTQYLNARNTLNRLLDWKVVPIVNENDTTATDELCFGDNDALAAQVALLVKADLLVLLTDTDGLYTADPREDGEARLITRVEDASELECVRIGAIGPLGSGGMGSKVNSARIATSGGVETVIARGGRPDVLKDCLAGEEIGTRFPPRPLGLPDYKLWLLYGKPARGKVVVDEGAVKALRGKGSLLPVGVIAVEGDFAAGDAVLVVGEDGTELAKGLVSYSREDLDRAKGLKSSRVAEVLPQASPEAIHRDYMVLAC
ncbi:MAG: glutamate 5-kinase [Actinobacteria bacterium RBG_16_64_13]|nr:MAG: glutamate 5-kinase [Actinobacteria bacterium RBG_16_64_13]